MDIILTCMAWGFGLGAGIASFAVGALTDPRRAFPAAGKIVSAPASGAVTASLGASASKAFK